MTPTGATRKNARQDYFFRILQFIVTAPRLLCSKLYTKWCIYAETDKMFIADRVKYRDTVTSRRLTRLVENSFFVSHAQVTPVFSHPFQIPAASQQQKSFSVTNLPIFKNKRDYQIEGVPVATGQRKSNGPPTNDQSARDIHMKI